MTSKQIGTGSKLPVESCRGLAKATIELIIFARQLLAVAHPMTLRQLHYAIFSAAVIAYTNTQADYKRLSRATTTARRAYRDWELQKNLTGKEAVELICHGRVPERENSIPPDWMIDETRNPETTSVWDNPAEFIETVKGAYRRDNWQDQENYCEVWSEKATILGSVRPVAKEFGITLRTCHGYGSTGMAQQIGRFFASLNKPITVYYLGDHDPSGVHIQTDIHEKVQDASGVSFEMRRLAIHAADIKAFNLPPQKIKDTDSRAGSFQKRFGQDAATVELDALPVNELRRRISEGVKSLLDIGRWNRALAVQDVEFASIASFAEDWKRIKSQDQPGGAV